MSRLVITQVRSKIEYFLSPVSALPVTSSFRNFFLSKGSRFHARSSALVGGTTDL